MSLLSIGCDGRHHRPPLYCVAAVVILSLPDSRFFNFSLSWLSVHTLHPLVVDSGEGVDVAYVHMCVGMTLTPVLNAQLRYVVWSSARCLCVYVCVCVLYCTYSTSRHYVVSVITQAK